MSLIKIYFPNGFLSISDPVDFTNNTPSNDSLNSLYLESPSEDSFLEHLNQLETSKLNSLNIVTNQRDIYMNLITAKYKVIEAAGGIIENENKELLFIYRRGKWDLPKGKMEPNESPEACAVREIEEETGVEHLNLIKKLTDTYHIYDTYGEDVLKISHWYALKSHTAQQLSPQTEEDITDIRWFTRADLHIPLANTFPTISDLVNVYISAYP